MSIIDTLHRFRKPIFLILVAVIIRNFTVEPDWNLESEAKFKMSPIINGTNKAVVLGGTGGIGKGIVRALARSPGYEKVTLLLRKEIQLPPSDATENYSKFEQKIMDFNKISEYSDLFKNHDAAFYAIGVSQTQVDEQTYKKIELENAIEIAQVLKNAGIPNVHWVTGKGVDENSWFLFGRIKAEVEKKIKELGFNRVAFYRPAAVITPEKSWVGVFKVFNVFGNNAAIHRDVIGEVMVANSLKNSDKNLDTFENRDMLKFAKSLK